jgi:hypothetical protein
VLKLNLTTLSTDGSRPEATPRIDSGVALLRSLRWSMVRTPRIVRDQEPYG